MTTLRRLLALASLAALTNGGQVQIPNLQLPSSAAAHQKDVVDIFRTSFEAYKEHAWGQDELSPVTESSSDTRNGWGATIVDALDTLFLLGMYEWFDEAVARVASEDFTRSPTNNEVSVFETTIRYVGGLLSAYELSGEKPEYYVLVKKAEDLANQMAYAFTPHSPIPFPHVNFDNQTVRPAQSNIAEAGSLTLEWNRLSTHTGNDTYRQLAENAVQHIIRNSDNPLANMPATFIDPATGNSVGSLVTWGPGGDSYYEYLIKYARLTNTDDNSYAVAWISAVGISTEILLRNSTVGNWTYLASYDGQILHVGSHLACFYGGNWILGGKLIGNVDTLNIGLRLTDACWNTYASTSTGIGPETFAYSSSDGGNTGSSPPTAEQVNFYNQHGFYITGSDYVMRPEVLESNFYAWRATGDMKYFNNAASALQSFRQYLPATVAYAGISDVNNQNSSKIDDLPSYWYAETLKYLYLTFDDPSRISLDDYVFNTECHPFKAPPAKDVYGYST